MTDYIKRDDALYTIECSGSWEETVERIRGNVYCPSADVAPVRHGRWMPLTDCSNEGIYCSACHKKVYRAEYSNTMKMHSAYCPNCGAKMDGGDTDA